MRHAVNEGEVQDGVRLLTHDRACLANGERGKEALDDTGSWERGVTGCTSQKSVYKNRTE